MLCSGNQQPNLLNGTRTRASTQGNKSTQMPIKPKRPCLTPNCPNLTDKTYCNIHEKSEKIKQRANHTHTSDPFYSTARWQKFRNWYRRKQPLCENCESIKLTIKAQLVDHIIPIKEGGKKLSSDNAQSLCRLCHARKTADDQIKYS